VIVTNKGKREKWRVLTLRQMVVRERGGKPQIISRHLERPPRLGTDGKSPNLSNKLTNSPQEKKEDVQLPPISICSGRQKKGVTPFWWLSSPKKEEKK